MSEIPFAPYLWPDPRHLESLAESPGGRLTDCLAQCDTVMGLLVDLTSEGVHTLRQVLLQKKRFTGSLVVALSPACPTRKEDLLQLLNLRDEFQGDDFRLQLRLLPLPGGVTSAARHAVLPPSSLFLQDSGTGQAWIWLGSNGDLDCHRPYHTASINLLLPAPPLVGDLWLRQFDYVGVRAAPLKAESIEIPQLVPAPGELEAARLWSDYCSSLYATGDVELTARVEIDPKTGEVRAQTADGAAVETATSFNHIKPLPAAMREILAALSRGSIVSIDEMTRVKPLAIPVKSFLFGKESVTNVGSVRHSQAFTLELLDETTAREINRCRKINDTVALLSFSLGQGMHWIPNAARPLLEKELDSLEVAAKKALGGITAAGVDDWIEKRWPTYEQDLFRMYRELNGGVGEPPRDRLDDVKREAHERLSGAINGRLVPKVSYAAFAPDIRGSRGEAVSDLGQILHLLQSAAARLREPYFDLRYFGRNFTKRGVRRDEWEIAMNALDDTAARRFGSLREDEASSRAAQERARIEEICGDVAKSDHAKLDELWALIHQSE